MMESGLGSCMRKVGFWEGSLGVRDNDTGAREVGVRGIRRLVFFQESGHAGHDAGGVFGKAFEDVGLFAIMNVLGEMRELRLKHAGGCPVAFLRCCG